MPPVTHRLQPGAILIDAVRAPEFLRRLSQVLVSFAVSALFLLQGAAIAWIFLNYGGKP